MYKCADGILFVPSHHARHLTRQPPIAQGVIGQEALPGHAYLYMYTFLCQEFLEPRGIAWTVYDPTVGIGPSLDARTRLVWVESPGSTTMEIQDLAPLVDAAHAKGALVGVDNSWATPLLCKPLAQGADLVVEALTKYAGGHGDLLLGSVTTRETGLFRQLKATTGMLGLTVAPDTCSLALRGLETMALRLQHAGKVALRFAHRLAGMGAGAAVLHPALPDHAGHALWRRYFTGSSGVFSVVLQQGDEERLEPAMARLKRFAIGASWGGTRSLVAPMTLEERRFGPFRDGRTILRLSIGLEDEAELWDDLAAMFAGLGYASA